MSSGLPRLQRACLWAAVFWPAALHGQTSPLTETAGISPRDVTAYNSPRIWTKKFHFFLVGLQTLLYFLESEVSETVQFTLMLQTHRRRLWSGVTFLRDRYLSRFFPPFSPFLLSDRGFAF